MNSPLTINLAAESVKSPLSVLSSHCIEVLFHLLFFLFRSESEALRGLGFDVNGSRCSSDLFIVGVVHVV